MMRRVWNAYRMELAKALRLKASYLGPILIVIATACGVLVSPVARDGQSDYAFIASSTTMSLHLLGLLVLITYCASLVSSELGSGTIRMVLVRPILRHEFLLAKLMLGMTYAVLLVLLVAATSWGIVLALGDLRGVNIGGEMLFTGAEMFGAYALAMLVGLCPLFAAVAYGLMISTMSRSTGGAASAAVGIWLLLDIVKSPLGIDLYMFSSYLETPYQVFSDRCDGLPASWFPQVGNCLLTSGVWTALFMVVAILCLRRRNLHG